MEVGGISITVFADDIPKDKMHEEDAFLTRLYLEKAMEVFENEADRSLPSPYSGRSDRQSI